VLREVVPGIQSGQRQQGDSNHARNPSHTPILVCRPAAWPLPFPEKVPHVVCVRARPAVVIS
jgi:hypothetical protein